jgi:hypothetical protein
MSKTKKQRDVAAFAKLVDEGVREKCLLSQIELGAEEEKRRLGQHLVDQKLASLPPENDRPKACPRCGKRARIRRRGVQRTFSSLSGSHTICRHYHYCEDCKEGFFPRDEFIGLPKEGEASIELEKRQADFLVNDVYETAELRWNFHYPRCTASANQFRQVAKRLGMQVEEASPDLLHSALLPPSEQQSGTLYIMADGGMVPMRGCWKEVKVGTMFRQENHLSRREAKRGMISTARYVAHLGGQDEFKVQMQAAYRIENVVPALWVVYLADGAPENWTLASAISPRAIQILDWYHAVENVMKCGRALLGENAVGLKSWEQSAKHLLMTGRVDTIVQELMDCLELTTDDEQLKALDDLVRYLRNNQGRMNYPEYLEKGLLIGSGAVESAHRHVIQTRMKKAGQHWGERGARQMARMRAAYRTAGPARFYDCIHWAYRETQKSTAQLQAIANAQKPPKRYASNR